MSFIKEIDELTHYRIKLCQSIETLKHHYINKSSILIFVDRGNLESPCIFVVNDTPFGKYSLLLSR
ncbi:hypothetical protein Syun_031123 [Stephania yunnanensis]|uniref:Uncharacterized protein n=1 Tax=Stephania yunnanensis TaxID=152371 RepID=A0AAP0HC50_9MAGN